MPPAEPPSPRAGERIAKLLARAGIASRREVERMIADGRVARDGVAIDTPATVLTSLDGITVDGQPVAAPAAARLFVYHKPPGLLVTERDPAGRPTIYDRLPPELPRVVPVGRLDLATEGLLLLTTDGGLKRQLELPATGVERTYRARAYGPVSQAQLEELIHGVEIEGMRYGPIDANLERRTGANGWIELTLTEGKNREVRRVLEYLGLEVSRLIRTRYGPFVLGDMAPGEVGEIRQHDLEIFRKTLKSGGGKAASAAATVMAEPLARPAPAQIAPATDRASPRATTRPMRRDGSERRPPTGSGDASGQPPPPSPPQAKLGDGDRSPQANGGGARRTTRPVRREGSDRRPPAGAGDASGQPPPLSPPQAKLGEGDRSPQANGGGARRTTRPGPLHPRAAPGGPPPRAGSGRTAPTREPKPASRPRERTGDDTPRPAAPARGPGWARAKPSGGPKPSRSASDRSPPSDRSRGPAGGRGKPKDPRGPKPPPRGKR